MCAGALISLSYQRSVIFIATSCYLLSLLLIVSKSLKTNLMLAGWPAVKNFCSRRIAFCWLCSFNWRLKPYNPLVTSLVGYKPRSFLVNSQYPTILTLRLVNNASCTCINLARTWIHVSATWPLLLSWICTLNLVAYSGGPNYLSGVHFSNSRDFG